MIVNAFVLIGVPLIMYLGQAAEYYFAAGRVGMAVAMLGYALGNVGLLLDRHGY